MSETPRSFEAWWAGLDPSKHSLDSDSHDAALLAWEAREAELAPSMQHTKSQIGSIDGMLTEALSHYERPAIKVRESKTGEEITCVLSEELAKQFDDSQSFFSIWLHHRITVHGLIRYNKRGDILQVVATSAERIETRDVSIEAIRDPDITGGMATDDYLNMIRGE